MDVTAALINKALGSASKGDLNTLKSLKEQIQLVRCIDRYGANSVHYAARAGKVDCLRWLIQTAGLSGSKPANNGATPAHDAAATGQLDCLQWLIQHGGCSLDSRDSCGATPLHLGISVEVLSYSVACLVSSASRFDQLSVVVWLVESENFDPLDRAQNNITPLHLAAAKGSMNVLRWLSRFAPR